MARPRIFTPTALAQVKSLVNQGASAAAIADEIGCTLGTLRVKCSQLGISLRRRMLGRRETTRTTKALVYRHPGSPVQSSGPPELLSVPLELPRFDALISTEPLVELNIWISQVAAEQLRQQATLSGVSAEVLAAELLVTITHDNLYQAILDQG
jgi:hypothetical protein